MGHEEYIICKNFWTKFKERYPKLVDAECLFNIEHGTFKLSKIVAGRLKATGQRRGLSDYLLKLKRGTYNSLWMEFKTPKGKLSPDQKKFQKLVIESGDKYVVCKSAEEGIKAIKDYLALDDVNKQQADIPKDEINLENLKR